MDRRCRIMQKHVCKKLHRIEHVGSYEVKTAFSHKTRLCKTAEEKLNHPYKHIDDYEVFGDRRPISGGI